MEANKGANWYSQTYANSVALTSSLRFSVLVNVMTLKKLIRKGIPPVLRPKVWFSLSGAAKKKSTVPDSYYDDLTSVVQDRVTPATKQIDHDCQGTSKNMVQS
ncbi:growth hormone-regulated TBC protein 1-like protein [Tanacetum coccineum]